MDYIKVFGDPLQGDSCRIRSLFCGDFCFVSLAWQCETLDATMALAPPLFSSTMRPFCDAALIGIFKLELLVKVVGRLGEGSLLLAR